MYASWTDYFKFIQLRFTDIVIITIYLVLLSFEDNLIVTVSWMQELLYPLQDAFDIYGNILL